MKMSLVPILLCSLLLVVCKGGHPPGYVLQVSHECGKSKTGAAVADGASVTIKSDLHVKAIVKCANNVNVKMTPITDANTMTTQTIFYTGDTKGNSKTDCFFSKPQIGSGLYVVEVNVYWGFTDGTLMHDYETYTITCTAEEHSEDTLKSKIVNDDAIAVKEGLLGNIASKYNGQKDLQLVDILGNKITKGTIPMSKKVKLALSISGGSEKGLTPYNCDAYNSDNSKTYRILNAGCGDGVIFPKDQGFTTKSTTATSPFFKVFTLLEAIGNSDQISYSCEFAICQNACDGSSCALRTKRSEDNVEQRVSASVSTPKYDLSHDRRLGRSKSDLKLQSRFNTSTIAIFGIGGVAILSLIIAVYSCMYRGHRELQAVPIVKCA